MTTALQEIQAAYPGRLMIPVKAAAPFIAKSPTAGVKLAQRGRFPVQPKKVGNEWMVSVRALATFIDGPDDEEEAPTRAAVEPKATKRKPGKSVETQKTVRPPSMSKALLAMRTRMEQTRLQLDLEQAVFAEMEAIAIRSAAEQKDGSKAKATPKAKSL